MRNLQQHQMIIPSLPYERDSFVRENDENLERLAKRLVDLFVICNNNN